MLLFYRIRNFSSFSPSTLALSPITGSFLIIKFWPMFLPQILLSKFQSISWRTSLHYLHPRRLEELHDLQVNNGQLFKIVKEIIWKTHILFFFSPPATVVFILFLLFEVGIRTTPDMKYFAASYV